MLITRFAGSKVTHHATRARRQLVRVSNLASCPANSGKIPCATLFPSRTIVGSWRSSRSLFMAKQFFGTDGIRGVPGVAPLDDRTL
ncbi:MAG: hypothetical protein ABSG16_24180, partial [Candidatus Acidiferrum sp.]